MEPPRSGNRITYDSLIPGFGLRVTKCGAKSFIVNYRIDGRERRLTVGSWPAWSATGARRRAKELRFRSSIDRREDPLDDKQQRRASPSFAAIAAEYLDRHAAKKKSGYADRLYLKRDVPPEWGNRKAEEVPWSWRLPVLLAQRPHRVSIGHRDNRSYSIYGPCPFPWRS